MNCVIFGAGGWGTAMAIHLARQGQTVTLVPRRAEQALALATTRENTFSQYAVCAGERPRGPTIARQLANGASTPNSFQAGMAA